MKVKVDRWLSLFFYKKNYEYVKKLWEHFYDCMHHGPV